MEKDTEEQQEQLRRRKPKDDVAKERGKRTDDLSREEKTDSNEHPQEYRREGDVDDADEKERDECGERELDLSEGVRCLAERRKRTE
jgi:hypothetical protein